MLCEDYTYDIPDVGTYTLRYRYPSAAPSSPLLPLELYFEPHDLWTPPQDPFLALVQHFFADYVTVTIHQENDHV